MICFKPKALKKSLNSMLQQVSFISTVNQCFPTLKKAHEIFVLCDVEVALIAFSTKGKLFEYSIDSRFLHLHPNSDLLNVYDFFSLFFP